MSDSDDDWNDYRTSREYSKDEEDMEPLYTQCKLLHAFDCQERPSDLERMGRFIKEDPSSVNRSLESGIDRCCDYVPLMYAIIAQHVRCVNLLLRAGADPNIYIDRRPYLLEDLVIDELRYSYRECNKEKKIKYIKILKLLLKHGANPNILKTTSYILNEAIVNGLLNIVMLLLKHGAETDTDEMMTEDASLTDFWNDRYTNLTTPLYVAMKQGEVEIAKRIFLHGGIINLEELIEKGIVKSTEPPIPHQLITHLEVCLDMSVPHMYDPLSQDGRKINIVRMLKLYKEMGGDILIKNADGKTVFQVLEVTDLRGDEDNSRKNELTNLLNELNSSPLSLQSLARVAVIRAMGRGCWENICHLPIPKDVKRILRLRDL